MQRKTESRVYEAMFMVDSGDAAAWGDLTKHIANILSRSGAEIIGITRWDERKLAFTVKKRKRGTYVLAFFILKSGAALPEIERDCNLSEKVLRTILLRADHFSVADMRMQLGEDIHEDVAQKLIAERGEPATVAAGVVAKPAHYGDTETPVAQATATDEPPAERGRPTEDA